MSGNFILEFPTIQLPILTVMHARASKAVICSLCSSHGPYINIHDVCGLYVRLITALCAVKMCDAKIRKTVSVIKCYIR